MQQLKHGFDDVLGFGARYQDGWGHDQIHAPEFLMAGDVLRGDSTGALGQGCIIASRFIIGELSLGMRVEIGTVAAEHEHEKQFGVQAGRRDLRGCKPLEGYGLGGFELHQTISPQRAQRNTEETNLKKGSYFGFCPACCH